MTKVFLLDIEGTISAISFVKNVLFPYAHERIDGYVRAHSTDPAVQSIIADTIATVEQEQPNASADARPVLDRAIEALLAWSETDRKHTALKALQGLIWAIGYKEDKLKSFLYPEVSGVINGWLALGYRVAVYSSGSIQAQKQFFSKTHYGDLNPRFEAFFDTTTGPKKESDSYRKIAEALNVLPEEVHFLSDDADELKAAQTAGMRVTQIVRPDSVASELFDTAENLALVVRG